MFRDAHPDSMFRGGGRSNEIVHAVGFPASSPRFRPSIRRAAAPSLSMDVNVVLGNTAAGSRQAWCAPEPGASEHECLEEVNGWNNPPHCVELCGFCDKSSLGMTACVWGRSEHQGGPGCPTPPFTPAGWSNSLTVECGCAASSCDCQSDEGCCESVCQGTWEGYYCNTGSPILINLHSNGNDQLTSPERGVWFDINARGVRDRVAWTTARTAVGFLTLDRNQNGIVDNGSELFGTSTPLRDGTRARNGFDALYDLDGGAGVSDVQIDARDEAYSLLRLWIDANHNGYSEPHELQTLEQAGVTTVLAKYRMTRRQDRHGNRYKFAGTALLIRNGRPVERRIFDVFFQVLTR